MTKRRSGKAWFKPRYVVAEHLASGRLVETFLPLSGVRRAIVALYPPNRRSSAKVRAFLKMLT